MTEVGVEVVIEGMEVETEIEIEDKIEEDLVETEEGQEGIGGETGGTGQGMGPDAFHLIELKDKEEVRTYSQHYIQISAMIVSEDY